MILWDNDGVLVDTEKLYMQANVETLASIGVELSVADFIEISLVRGCSVFELAERHGHDARAVEALRRRRNERYTELLATGPPLMPAARETLEHLGALHDMAMVTGSRRVPDSKFFAGKKEEQLAQSLPYLRACPQDN